MPNRIAPGHIFYRKLNAILREAGFDRWVEDLCRPYYAETQGRPGIPPGTYFRMVLIGYFEGIGSQRGIAWRCSDSLSLRDFLGIPLSEESPDHSSLSVIRDCVPGPSQRCAIDCNCGHCPDCRSHAWIPTAAYVKTR